MKAKALFNTFRIALVVVFLFLPTARSYPPAPDLIIYGLVSDQYGVPLVNPSDLVVLQTSAGVQVVGSVQPNLAVGVNYSVRVPMDIGSISPPYVSNALTAGALYQLYVVVDGVTNLPIDMAAYASLGKPAQMVLRNLTVGPDANNDGIPDAWETAFLNSIGASVAFGSINPNADYANDGHTLKQEYALGNYPFRTNAFAVSIVNLNAGSALLAFNAAASVTYTATGSADLLNWTPLTFTIPGSTNVLSSYYSATIQPFQIQTLQPASAPPIQFFRLQFQ